MTAGLVGWGGPIPILLICIWIFRHRLSVPQRAAFVLVVYAISILTGALADIVLGVGNFPSAVIAGVAAPAAYGLLFGLASRWLTAGSPPPEQRQTGAGQSQQQSGSAPVPAPPPQAEPQGATVAARAKSGSQWNPIIIAALIQAVASVLVALISVLGD